MTERPRTRFALSIQKRLHCTNFQLCTLIGCGIISKLINFKPKLQFLYVFLSLNSRSSNLESPKLARKTLSLILMFSPHFNFLGLTDCELWSKSILVCQNSRTKTMVRRAHAKFQLCAQAKPQLRLQIFSLNCFKIFDENQQSDAALTRSENLSWCWHCIYRGSLENLIKQTTAFQFTEWRHVTYFQVTVAVL